MVTTRPEWPHTVDDIIKSLDGIWGLVGAKTPDGNILRLERSLHEPYTYSLTEYQGQDETKILTQKTYSGQEKNQAVGLFASRLGFSDN